MKEVEEKKDKKREKEGKGGEGWKRKNCKSLFSSIKVDKVPQRKCLWSVCGGEEIDMRKTFHVFIKTPYSVAVTSILLLCFCSRTLKTQVTIEIRKFTSASPINHSNVEVKMLCLCNFTRVTQLMTDSNTESRLSSLCGLHSVKDFFFYLSVNPMGMGPVFSEPLYSRNDSFFYL